MTEALLRQFADRPRMTTWSCLAGVSLVAWTMLGQMADVESAIAVLCSADGSATSASILAMWLAMSLAMMLPTAAPMISVYMDLAEAARTKAIAVVPPLVLAAGYVTVWIGFSALAAALQIALLPLDTPSWAAGLLFVGAGLYQFAPLKQACLRKCRSPMPYFLGHWSEKTADVYRMGLSQGLSCLGCCWALMLLALAAGTMNILWMAGMALLMMLEKMLPRPKPLTFGVGLGLIGAGAAMIAGQ